VSDSKRTNLTAREVLKYPVQDMVQEAHHDDETLMESEVRGEIQ